MLMYPNLRGELIQNLSELADLEFQKKYWIDQCYDTAKHLYNFDEIIHFLYDDLNFKTLDNNLLGQILYSNEEFFDLKNVLKELDSLFDTIGMDKPDIEYVEHPKWENIINLSKKALDTIKKIPKDIHIKNICSQNCIQNCKNVNEIIEYLVKANFSFDDCVFLTINLLNKNYYDSREIINNCKSWELLKNIRNSKNTFDFNNKSKVLIKFIMSIFSNEDFVFLLRFSGVEIYTISFILKEFSKVSEKEVNSIINNCAFWGERNYNFVLIDEYNRELKNIAFD